MSGLGLNASQLAGAGGQAQPWLRRTGGVSGSGDVPSPESPVRTGTVVSSRVRRTIAAELQRPRLRTLCPARPRNSGLFVRHGAVLPRHRRHRARWPSAENKGPFGHRSAFSDRRARVSRARFLGGCDQLRARRFERLDIPSFRRDCRTVRSIFSFEMACVLQPVGSRSDSLNHFRPVRARRDTGIAAPIS